MFRSKVRLLIAVLIMTTLVLSGCQNQPEITPSLTATPFTPDQATATPEPTQSPTATSPAAEVTTTSAPSQYGPVIITQWDNLSLTNESLPELAGEITPNNAAQVVPLAIWGFPRANTIALSADGQILAVGNDLGAMLYDSISYAQIVQILTPYPVSMIAFSADNQYIAFGQQEGVIDIVSKEDMALLNRLNFDQPEDFLGKDIQLAFSPESDSLLLMAQSPDQIHLIRWDTATWYVSVNLILQQGLAAYLSAALDLAGVIYNQPDLLLQSLSYTEESDLLDMPSSI